MTDIREVLLVNVETFCEIRSNCYLTSKKREKERKREEEEEIL